MSILVTGSSGYIGSRLVRRFHDRGETVFGVDRLPYEGACLDEAVTGDLLEASTLEETPMAVDCI